jgi:hypothetical protein
MDSGIAWMTLQLSCEHSSPGTGIPGHSSTPADIQSIVRGPLHCGTTCTGVVVY